MLLQYTLLPASLQDSMDRAHPESWVILGNKFVAIRKMQTDKSAISKHCFYSLPYYCIGTHRHRHSSVSNFL